ncbi:hypothetical protein ACEWY4_027131 [Coilia grayii]|uniref:IRS-type PTB domain-containing protein n=1 Tax=Coilia grayii TaxID=363190 RepID=A0ABD1IRN4_9TELE
MDVIEKEGLVLIQGIKFGKKSWKRTWMILYQPSSSGIGRIELYEVKDGLLGFSGTSRPPGLKRMEKRVIRLSDCLSISPAPEESCPTEFITFDVNTTQRMYTFATPSNEDWMQSLCELAFMKTDVTSDARKIPRGEDTSMSENELYSSWKTGQYQVKVQQTEAAMRCGLAGSYALSPSSEALSLQDLDTSEVIYCWPYRLLRRFGTVKARHDVALQEGGVTIEAGRRCESGEGHFVFLCRQGQEIYRTMEEAIAKHKQTGRHQEHRPGPPPAPEQAAHSLIPRPPSLDKQRGPTALPALPALPRRNISLPEVPVKPQQPSSQKDIHSVIDIPPAPKQKDIYSVIDIPPAPKPQPKPPRMRQNLPYGLPSLDSREKDEEERCNSVGSDSFCNTNEDSVIYSKLRGVDVGYEEATNGRDRESPYSTVARHSPSPRRAQLEKQGEREEEEEEEEEREREWEFGRERERSKERQREWSRERERSKEQEQGSQIVTTTSEISVNFKQTLANMLFKDLAKVQLQAAKPTGSADPDGTIYQNPLDM